MTKSITYTRFLLPNRICFSGKIKEELRGRILDILIINFKGTKCKKLVKVNENFMFLEGEFFSFKPSDNVPWNIWVGFARRAEIHIINVDEIQYILDFAYGAIISLTVFISFFFIIPFLFKFSISKYYVIDYILICPTILISRIAIDILRHRRIFYYTLKHGSIYTGDYNWSIIFKNRTHKELEDISLGRTTHTQEVQDLAKEELIKRTKQ
jgi:hypothetical protein